MLNLKIPTIIILLVFIFWGCQLKNENRPAITRSFFNAIATFSVKDSSEIKRRFLDTSNLSKDSKIFLQLLSSVQKDISNKEFSRFSVASYDNLKKKDQNIFMENFTQEDIYAVKYEDKPYIYVLFNGDRVRSFTTMNKGTYRYFVKL